jgi:hypothetical protein
MDQERITNAKIDELLRFLEPFEEPGRSFVRRWAGGERRDDGVMTIPYPVYAEDVLEFFHLAGQACWSDTQYDPSEAAQQLADDAFIQAATLDQVKTLLTYCVRGERFSDGHWEGVLKSGRVGAILRRLAVLRESLDAGGNLT